MPKAIIFDFDGVLVESVDVKGQAFVELYKDESPAIQKAVLDYHNNHGGVSRYDKIRYFESTLLKKNVTDELVNMKADQFSDIVEKQVVAAKWVTGALEFLKTYSEKISLFVASATPQEELLRIVEKRNASHFFKQVLGTPITKQQHIAQILKDYGWNSQDVFMIGDATTDYKAALANKVPFIGRHKAGTENPFPAGTVIIPDLTALAVHTGLA